MEGRRTKVRDQRQFRVISKPPARAEESVAASFVSGFRDASVGEQRDNVLAPDGQQLTLTTTGTLESGQQLTEKLVFKKK